MTFRNKKTNHGKALEKGSENKICMILNVLRTVNG